MCSLVIDAHSRFVGVSLTCAPRPYSFIAVSSLSVDLFVIQKKIDAIFGIQNK